MKSVTTIGLVVSLALAVAAAERSARLKSSVRGTDQLSVYGKADHPMWLGVSFYSKAGKPEHQLVPLSKGRFRKNFTIDPRLQGGSYEVALWDAKVTRDFCQVRRCQYCPTYGYHLSGMAASGSGALRGR